MRVPDAGQDLVERRIVREGKRLAEAMLADYRDPARFSLPSLGRLLASLRQQAMHALGFAARS